MKYHVTLDTICSVVIEWHVDVVTRGKQSEFDDGHVWIEVHRLW